LVAVSAFGAAVVAVVAAGAAVVAGAVPVCANTGRVKAESRAAMMMVDDFMMIFL
jgi:hypothetical protein